MKERKTNTNEGIITFENWTAFQWIPFLWTPWSSMERGKKLWPLCIKWKRKGHVPKKKKKERQKKTQSMHRLYENEFDLKIGKTHPNV